MTYSVSSAIESGTDHPVSQSSQLLGCNYCMTTFDRLERLISHKKRYHQKDMDDEEISENEPQQEETGSFPCKHSECDRDFPTHKARATHMARAHKEFKAFACDYCPESFSVNRALIVHVQRVHVKVPEETEIKLHNAEEQFICPHCPKKYEKLNSLQGHLLRVHPGTPRCTAEELKTIGGTDFNDKEQVEQPVIEEPMKRGRGRPPLVKPQKATFTSPAAVDPLKCDMCNKSFATVDFLQNHKLTHTPVDLTKPYCDVCGQIFKGHQYVARHKKFSACGGTVKMVTESPSNDDTVPSTASRKRRHDETSDNIDQECSVNESMDMSPPKTKQLLMKEDHMIKTEQNDSYEDVGNRSMAPEVGSPRSQQLSDTEEKTTSIAPVLVPVSNKTHTSTPLTIVVFNRADESPEELLIVWSTTLNEDLLTVAKLQANNVILCVQETNVVNLPETAKGHWNQSNKAMFYMSLKGEMSHWTVISFGEQHPPRDLTTIKQAFKSFKEVEAVFVQHAATLAMGAVHIVKYEKYGLFPLLSNSLASKMIGTNYQQ